jgi:hypothetical protein
MKLKNAPNFPLCQQTPKQRFSMALLSTAIAFPGFSLAQDGIRNLREPTDMEKVAPVRAVGIRVSPVLPLDLDAKQKARETNIQPTPPVALANPTVSISASPSSVITAPATKIVPSRSPERIVPKSKFVLASSRQDSAPNPSAKLPSPIPIPTTIHAKLNEGVALASETKQSDGNEVIATESVATTEATRRIEPILPLITKPVVQADPTAVSALAVSPTPSTISPQEFDRATVVELESQGTVELPIDYPVQDIIVRNETVCRAMASSTGVYLVGLSLGESIVEIKSKDDGASRLFRVKVLSPWRRSGGLADIDQLVHTIQPLSPNGILSVQAQSDGSIVVRGKVDNQETAKRIMEITRKLVLVPVVDKLEIR